MNNDFMISLLATFGKYKIENSQLSRMEKEVWKFEVDLLEHFLKSINKQQFSNKKDIIICASASFFWLCAVFIKPFKIVYNKRNMTFLLVG